MIRTWFKHNANASGTTLMRALLERYDYRGPGIYWRICETLILHQGTCHLDELLTLARRGMPKKDIRAVLSDFGAFCIDKDDMVTLADPDLDAPLPSCALTHEGADAPAPSPAPPGAGTSAPPPGSSLREEEKNIEESPQEKESPTPFVPDDYTLQGIRAQLAASDANQIWREAVCLQHPKARPLLEAHWDLCIDCFWQELIATGGDFFVHNIGKAKSYFCNYLAKPRNLTKIKSRLRELEGKPPLDNSEERLLLFLQQRCPHLLEMDEPLNYAEFSALCEHHPLAEIQSVLIDMNNRSPLNYRSCYQAAESWLNYRKEHHAKQ